ncbi:MAG: DoxX family membrane protein [Desulfamplus sp.]|nr:DoxX family membrane protein [Desulfamplus sp.]
MNSNSSTNSKSTIQTESKWKALLFNTFLFNSIRILMGVVFMYASYDKILHPEAFAKAVFNYQILPDTAVNIAALVLPWLELLIGLSLVAGIWLEGSTVISTSLMMIFIGSLIFNQIRGLDIHCGCFSTDATQGPAGIWTIMRDFSFLAASIYLTFRIFFFSKSPNI